MSLKLRRRNAGAASRRVVLTFLRAGSVMLRVALTLLRGSLSRFNRRGIITTSAATMACSRLAGRFSNRLTRSAPLSWLCIRSWVCPCCDQGYVKEAWDRASWNVHAVSARAHRIACHAEVPLAKWHALIKARAGKLSSARGLRRGKQLKACADKAFIEGS